MPFLLALMMAGQSVAVSPPPTPPWGQAEQFADRLRRACMSEAGIAIAVKGWSESQAAAKAEVADNDKMQRELGEAAYTAPIDVNRLDSAAQARNTLQARQEAERTRRDIETLRKMSPQDRIIFARDLAVYRPPVPPRVCPTNVR